MTAAASADRQDMVVITRGRAGAAVRSIQRACEQGQWARVAAGIYLRERDPELQAQLVRAHWVRIVGALAPGSVVSHRSACDLQDEPSGCELRAPTLVLSHPTRFNRTLCLPGLNVMLVRGPAAMPEDQALGSGELHRSSTHRMLLENLVRRRGANGRSLGQAAVAQRLQRVLDRQGAGELLAIRAQAHRLAPAMTLDREFAHLAALIDRLAVAGPRTRRPHVDAAGEPAAGVQVAPPAVEEPADEACMTLLRSLAERLRSAPPQGLAARSADAPARAHLAFVEAYFASGAAALGVSIEQARNAVFSERAPPDGTPLYSDLRALYRMALQPPLCDTVPPYGAGFAQALQARHAILLQHSPQAAPGRLRTRAAPAAWGLVAPGRIDATLADGTRLARSVPDGLPRAILYSVLLWRVHPFEHGNERMTRLIVNAELAGVAQARIVIPTLMRRALLERREQIAAGRDPYAYLQMMAALQRWSAALDGADLDRLIDTIRRTGALRSDRSDAELKMPDAVDRA